MRSLPPFPGNNFAYVVVPSCGVNDWLVGWTDRSRTADRDGSRPARRLRPAGGMIDCYGLRLRVVFGSCVGLGGVSS